MSNACGEKDCIENMVDVMKDVWAMLFNQQFEAVSVPRRQRNSH